MVALCEAALGVGVAVMGAMPAGAAGVRAPDSGISIFWSLPFVLLLLSIALMPFAAKHWWEKNYARVSAVLAVGVAAYYILYRQSPTRWLHEMREYVSFIVLLGSLFVVSGGVAIRIHRRATPLMNATLLLIGALLSNVFGTTGAAMLLIRPYLDINRGHLKGYHIAFFIFIVANVGGSLTPIGDPPLFLGYLKGVPFWWVAEHMIRPWAMVVGLLLAIFLVMDHLDCRKTARRSFPDWPTFQIFGIQNFLFIGVIVWAVFRPSLFDAIAGISNSGWSGGCLLNLIFSREWMMLAAALLSRRLTRGAIYKENDFSMGPIREVAILFIGIFSTMTPAMHWLEHNSGKLRIHSPGQYYFASGALSSVLDNAPTYLTFLKAQLSELDPAEVDEVGRVLEMKKGGKVMAFNRREFRSERGLAAAKAMVKYHEKDVRRGTISRDELEAAFLIGLPRLNILVLAISAGSVFWGACTYIGNGPNLMVKSIADASGAAAPPFMAYIYKYSLPILIPVYVLVWIVFFRPGR